MADMRPVRTRPRRHRNYIPRPRFNYRPSSPPIPRAADFMRFLQMPPELQFAVWDMVVAALPPRVITSDASTTDDTASIPGLRGLLGANWDSRQTVLKTYSLLFGGVVIPQQGVPAAAPRSYDYFNPALDTLYFHRADGRGDVWLGDVTEEFTAYLPLIRNLALHVERTGWGKLMKGLVGVRNLTVFDDIERSEEEEADNARNLQDYFGYSKFVRMGAIVTQAYIQNYGWGGTMIQIPNPAAGPPPPPVERRKRFGDNFRRVALQTLTFRLLEGWPRGSIRVQRLIGFRVNVEMLLGAGRGNRWFGEQLGYTGEVLDPEETWGEPLGIMPRGMVRGERP